MLTPQRTLVVIIPSIALGITTLCLVFNEPQSTAQPSARVALVSILPQTPPTVVTTDVLRLALIRMDLDPASLAASGIAPESVSSVVHNARTTLETAVGALSVMDANLAHLGQSVDTLARKVQAGLGEEGDATSLVAARMELADAIQNQEAMLSAIHTAAISPLTGEAQSRLRALRINRAWEMPAPYLVVERTGHEWVGLRDALAEERFCAQTGSDLSPELQVILATFRSDPAIAQGLSNTEVNLEIITSSWNNATNQ